MRLFLVLVLVLFTSVVRGQQAPRTTVDWHHTEEDAVGWAFDALANYPAEVRPWVRFVYLPHWADAEWLGVMDVAVNMAASHTTTLVRGDRHAGGWLLAYRLDLLAPDPVKRKELVRIWDFLALRESRFHVPETNVVEVVEEGRRVKRNVRSAILSPHLAKKLASRAGGGDGVRVDELVVQLTRSTGGVYPADFLLEQLLTSDRGLYPEFRQYKFKTQKFTPLVSLLKDRGFFPGETEQRLGDKGALILLSDVTGKSRLVFVYYGLASGVPLAYTYDFKDSRIRPDEQFVRNLVEFHHLADASELFVPMPNGFVEFVLSDAKGNLQRVAPPDVVADFTKPDGHTKQLEMGMSCINCHFPQNGYRTAKNDMELLIGSKADFIGDDVSFRGRKLTREEAVALVVGRYGERIDSADGPLGRARRDLIKAVDVLTDYPITADGPTCVQAVGEKIKSIYHAYRYGRIDADRACMELGVSVPEGRGRAWLEHIASSPYAGEDVMIALLKNGAVLKRDDFEPIYVELARRRGAYFEKNKHEPPRQGELK